MKSYEYIPILAILLTAVVLIIAVVFIGGYVYQAPTGPTPTPTPTPTPALLGVLEGATNYTGAYPASAIVRYTDTNGQSMDVLAYPGQIQVFFDSLTSQEYAEAAIQASGGNIIGAIPLTGYYLVEVAMGFEDAFITSILQDSRVNAALPNLAMSLSEVQEGVLIDESWVIGERPVPLNITGPVAIDSGDHALDVIQAAESQGGFITNVVSMSAVEDEDGNVSSDKVNYALTAIAQGNDIFNPGNPALVNVSFNGGFLKDVTGDGDPDWVDYAYLTADEQREARNGWLAVTESLLRGVHGLPSDLKQDLFVTMSAGNNNMPLDDLLDVIEHDPDLGAVLSNYFQIVGTALIGPESAAFPDGKFSNYVSNNNPNVIILNNLEAANGTSLASPAAMALLQRDYPITLQLMSQVGVTLAQATLAAKLARDTNANNELVLEEALDKARIILDTAQTETVSAFSVTGIDFTSLGGVTAAVIYPSIPGVTVQYTVSGTDGYYDSGSLRTDAYGQVSFSIPAGEPGVTDTISVSAVLSGLIATATYTW